MNTSLFSSTEFTVDADASLIFFLLHRSWIVIKVEYTNSAAARGPLARHPPRFAASKTSNRPGIALTASVWATLIKAGGTTKANVVNDRDRLLALPENTVFGAEIARCVNENVEYRLYISILFRFIAKAQGCI